MAPLIQRRTGSARAQMAWLSGAAFHLFARSGPSICCTRFVRRPGSGRQHLRSPKHPPRRQPLTCGAGTACTDADVADWGCACRLPAVVDHFLPSNVVPFAVALHPRRSRCSAFWRQWPTKRRRRRPGQIQAWPGRHESRRRTPPFCTVSSECYHAAGYGDLAGNAHLSAVEGKVDLPPEGMAQLSAPGRPNLLVEPQRALNDVRSGSYASGFAPGEPCGSCVGLPVLNTGSFGHAAQQALVADPANPVRHPGTR